MCSEPATDTGTVPVPVGAPPLLLTPVLYTNENAAEKKACCNWRVSVFVALFAYLFNAGRTTRQQRPKNIKARKMCKK